MEKTLVILKPDAVRRQLIGRILCRLEDAGLDIERCELLTADASRLEKHYESTDEWLRGVGEKTLEDYQRRGVDPKSSLGTEDAREIGILVKSWLVEYMSSGRIVVIVVSGNRAVESVRKLVGATLPVSAAPGTIRGDFSTDSPDAANAERRPVQNLVHASGSVDEARREIKLWFDDGLDH